MSLFSFTDIKSRPRRHWFSSRTPSNSERKFPRKRIYAVGYDEPTLTYLAEMDLVELREDEKYLSIVCDTANTPRIDDERYKMLIF